MQVVTYRLEWSTKVILVIIVICLMGILLKPFLLPQKRAEAGGNITAEKAYYLAKDALDKAEEAYSYADDAYYYADDAYYLAEEAYYLAEDAYY